MVEAAAEAAEARGVRSMVGFNYRRVPAIALARKLVADGRLGTIRHVRAQYLQDWIVDPSFPLVWRLQKDKAGSGALGDIGAHIVDLAAVRHRRDRSPGSPGCTETFVKERPLPAASSGLSGVRRRRDRARSPSTTPRCSSARFDRRRARRRSRPPGSPPAARTRMRLEINGSRRQPRVRLRGDERAAVLRPHRGPPRRPGFRRILVTEPTHPYVGAWWPPGHGLGYEHSFTHEVVDLVTRHRRRAATRAVVRRRPAGAAGARRGRAQPAGARTSPTWHPIDTSTERSTS